MSDDCGVRGAAPGAETGAASEPPGWLTRVRPRLEAARDRIGRVEPGEAGEAGEAQERADAAAQWFTTFAPPPDPWRRSAVLMVFSPAPDDGSDGVPRSDGPGGDGGSRRLGVRLLLTERAHTLRAHAAQVVVPGGHVDPGDDGPVGAALREAQEEVGLDPASVTVVDELPPLYLHPAGTAVHPVLAWWPRPHPLRVVDEAEVARILSADVDAMLDPAHRFTVVAPDRYRGPGFEVGGLVVWGFTANLVDHVMELAGVAPAWDGRRQRPLPDYLASAYWPR